MSTTLYDVVSYPGHLQPEAHPDRLAALGRLFALPTAPPETCRVLELGCGDGANLIPQAATLPQAAFLGIDLSASAIARGQAAIAAVGIPNATLRQMDLLALPPDLGHFDYIIAHGLYSWVPAPVRERIMHLCQTHLAPHGLAYISYNVLPGCRLRQVAGELMRFHTAGTEPAAQVAKAREILKLAAESVAPDTAYGAVLKAEQKRIADAHDSLIFHDDLAGATPLLFHEFAAHAAAHGLQYLCDAKFKQDANPQVQPRSAAFLETLGETDLIRREQYADFVLGRAFRRSLLCHAAAPLTRPVAPQRLRSLRIASPLRPTPAKDGEAVNPASDAVAQFQIPQGKSISINLPLAKAALLCLAESWPQSVPFEQLFARARHLSRGKGHQDEDTLARFLLTALAAALVEVHTLPAPIVTAVSQRPLVSPLTRWQARQGQPFVSTLTGATVRLEGQLAARLLILLDGTRTLSALSRELAVPQPALFPKLRELAGAGVLTG